jgi:ribosomal protein S18 acetylase RimI-like enzyme
VNSWNIVKYAEPHFDGVAALWQEAFPNPQPWNAPEVTIRAKLAMLPELFLVAIDKEQIIGSILAGYDGHRGWLYAVAVLKAHQRRGVGSALVREAERRLLELGCVKINLQIQGANASVAEFYRRLGYEVEERVSMGKRLGRFA